MTKTFPAASAARVATALAISLLLSSCWTQVGFGPERQRFNPTEQALTADNAATLHEEWAVELLTDDEPIVSDGRVFVGHGTPTTYAWRAVDAATGATEWEYVDGRQPADFPMIATPVTVAAGQVWASYAVRSPELGRCGGVQLKLDPADGTATRQPGVIGYPPAEAGGAIAQIRTRISSPDCGSEVTTLQVTPASGTPWSYTIDGSGPVGLPAIIGQQVIVSVDSDVLSFPLNGCGAPTCAPTWTSAVGNPGDAAEIAQLVVGAGHVFVVTTNSQSQRAVLVALRLDGTFAWNAEVGGSNGRLALAGDRLFLLNSGTGVFLNTLQAFDASGCGSERGCTPLWRAEVGVASLGEGPVVAGGVVYAGRSDSVVGYPVDGCGAEFCSPIAFVDVGGDPQGMSVSDGRLFVTTGTRLVALAPQQPG
jgi:hypothetical protein